MSIHTRASLQFIQNFAVAEAISDHSMCMRMPRFTAFRQAILMTLINSNKSSYRDDISIHL